MGRKIRELSRVMSAYTFVMPYVLPPKENVIQGLARPDRPRRVKPRRNNDSKNERRRMQYPICNFCDFWDKGCGYCLIKRFGGVCPYLNGGNGYAVIKLNGK